MENGSFSTATFWLGKVQVSVKAFLEGDHCFSALNTIDLLHFIVEYLLQVIGIPAMDLHEHRVVACSIMNAGDLLDFLEFRDNFVV